MILLTVLAGKCKRDVRRSMNDSILYDVAVDESDQPGFNLHGFKIGQLLLAAIDLCNFLQYYQ